MSELFGNLDAGARRELWWWSALAMLSLAVSGVFAVLLALSRVPGIQDVFPWPLDFFHKGLVIHVVFSFVVWFLAVFGGLLHLAAVRLGGARVRLNGLGMAGVAATAVASVLLFAPALLDRGEASLNNYVPVIIDPLYYLGLAVLGGGIALAVVRLLANLAGRRAPLEPFTWGMTATGMVYIAALVCVLVAGVMLGGEELSHAFNEELFWGGGHVLQFVNTMLLIVALYVLARLGLGAGALSDRLCNLSLALLAALGLAAPFFYLAFEAFSEAQTMAFTNLQYGLAPSSMAVGLAIAAAVLDLRRRGRALPWGEPAFLCLVLAPVVFGVGGVLGLFVDGADTRTPAHYHGVIAGINVAFMGLFYGLFLPLLGRRLRGGGALHAQVWLFAGGQTLASIGLFLAGGYGAPRKTAGEAQGLEDLGAIVGMALNGIGALIAVIGGVMFIWMVSAALLGKPQSR